MRKTKQNIVCLAPPHPPGFMFPDITSMMAMHSGGIYVYFLKQGNMKKSKRQKPDFALSTASYDTTVAAIYEEQAQSARGLGHWVQQSQTKWGQAPLVLMPPAWSNGSGALVFSISKKCPHRLPVAKTQCLGLLNFQEVPPLAFSSLII